MSVFLDVENNSGGDSADGSAAMAGNNAVCDKAAASCRRALSTKNESHPLSRLP
jgi:hypothetical protein